MMQRDIKRLMPLLLLQSAAIWLVVAGQSSASYTQIDSDLTHPKGLAGNACIIYMPNSAMCKYNKGTKSFAEGIQWLQLLHPRTRLATGRPLSICLFGASCTQRSSGVPGALPYGIPHRGLLQAACSSPVRRCSVNGTAVLVQPAVYDTVR